MKKTVLCIFCLTSSLFAQNDADQANFAYWAASLPGGSYMVRLSAVQSVSMHSYVVDGAAKVYELNLVTSSPVQARFYFVDTAFTPSTMSGVAQTAKNRLKEIATEVSERSGSTGLSTVIKSYPATTHAKTIEYQITSYEKIQQMHSSLRRAWMRNKTASVTITE